jgi:hypothetical protein
MRIQAVRLVFCRFWQTLVERVGLRRENQSNGRLMRNRRMKGKWLELRKKG